MLNPLKASATDIVKEAVSRTIKPGIAEMRTIELTGDIWKLKKRIKELEDHVRLLTGNTFHDALCLAFEDGSWEHDVFDRAKSLVSDR